MDYEPLMLPAIALMQASGASQKSIQAACGVHAQHKKGRCRDRSVDRRLAEDRPQVPATLAKPVMALVAALRGKSVAA